MAESLNVVLSPLISGDTTRCCPRLKLASSCALAEQMARAATARRDKILFMIGYGLVDGSLLPVEVVYAGSDLEMIFRYAEVHQGISQQRNALAGCNLGLSVVCRKILEMELLLIDGSRGEEGSIDTVIEPFRGVVAGVADLSRGFDLVRNALGLAVSDGDIASDLLVLLKDISSRDLTVAHAYPAGVEPQCLRQQD